MLFKDKYLKYKQKYHILRNNLNINGGEGDDNNNIMEEGNRNVTVIVYKKKHFYCKVIVKNTKFKGKSYSNVFREYSFLIHFGDNNTFMDIEIYKVVWHNEKIFCKVNDEKYIPLYFITNKGVYLLYMSPSDKNIQIIDKKLNEKVEEINILQNNKDTQYGPVKIVKINDETDIGYCLVVFRKQKKQKKHKNMFPVLYYLGQNGESLGFVYRDNKKITSLKKQLPEKFEILRFFPSKESEIHLLGNKTYELYENIDEWIEKNDITATVKESEYTCEWKSKYFPQLCNGIQVIINSKTENSIKVKYYQNPKSLSQNQKINDINISDIADISILLDDKVTGVLVLNNKKEVYFCKPHHEYKFKLDYECLMLMNNNKGLVIDPITSSVMVADFSIIFSDMLNEYYKKKYINYEPLNVPTQYKFVDVACKINNVDLDFTWVCCLNNYSFGTRYGNKVPHNIKKIILASLSSTKHYLDNCDKKTSTSLLTIPKYSIKTMLDFFINSGVVSKKEIMEILENL